MVRLLGLLGAISDMLRGSNGRYWGFLLCFRGPSDSLRSVMEDNRIFKEVFVVLG